jgi:hypothetical protein
MVSILTRLVGHVFLRDKLVSHVEISLSCGNYWSLENYVVLH